MALHRAHQADSWAIQALTAASFFTRVLVHWLRQLQSRIPPEDIRAHQDLCKMLTATEYTADANLAFAKFPEEATASSLMARCMWLHHWCMDTKNKWKLFQPPLRGKASLGSLWTCY